MPAPTTRINKKMIELLDEGRSIMWEKTGEEFSRAQISRLAAEDLIQSDFIRRLEESFIKPPVSRRRHYEFKL